MNRSNRLTAFLTGRGILSAAEVTHGLGVSKPTLSRLSAEAGDTVVRMGQARATRYAAAREVAGLPRRLPVFRIREDGTVDAAGRLRPLDGGGTWVEPARGPGHLHEGLLPVIVDMTPAGYLGRRFAARHADLGLPSRLLDWSDDHRLIAVARRGDDSPGDLIVGEESLQRFLDSSLAPVTTADFPRLAKESGLSGAGSSAAGEQAKFAAFLAGRHVLVKFSPGDGSPADQRWRDLLVCEALALEALAAHGISCSRAEVVDVATRRFLVVERFDRVGARGRVGVLTLGPLDDDLYGQRDTWTRATGRLTADGLLDDADARRVRLLDAFGIQIGNGDRHFGNLAFYADGLALRSRLRLAPVYDMLPMDFAPAQAAGVVPGVSRPALAVRAELIDVWEEARSLADQYLGRVVADPRVSAGFRAALARA